MYAYTVMDHRTRILIADDDAQMRRTLRTALDGMDDVAVVAEAVDGHDAVELTKLHRPNIVLMDTNMPRLNGLDATIRITRQVPRVRVIMVSLQGDGAYVHQAIAAGARGYVPKNAAPVELEAAVRFVSRGGVYIGRRLVPQKETIGPARG